MAHFDRRHFLKLASTYGMALNASTAGPDYKAVVLVTLAGGNDGNNMVVPLDSHQYASYASIRGGVALSQGSLLPLSAPSGGQN